MASTLVIFGGNLLFTVTRQNEISKDFSLYATIINQMKSHATITTPHFIYPLLVAIASEMFPQFSYTLLGAGLVLFFQLILAHVLLKCLKEFLPDYTPALVPVILTLAIMIIAPINLFTLPAHNLYFGYIGITVYHNPPIAICRPLALLHFLMFSKGVSDRTASIRHLVWCGITMVIATLMKPNYALVMVPSAVVFAGMSMLRKDVRTLRFIVFGTLIPALLILVGQFLFTYIAPNVEMGESHIIFAPLLIYGDRSHYILIKFALSILFPLSVLIVFGRQAFKDRYVTIALWIFVAGAIQSYEFAESGTRMYYGNFLWSAQLGLFLWFIASIRYTVQSFTRERSLVRWSWKSIVLFAVFSLHVMSGITWYLHETISPGAFW